MKVADALEHPTDLELFRSHSPERRLSHSVSQSSVGTISDSPTSPFTRTRRKLSQASHSPPPPPLVHYHSAGEVTSISNSQSTTTTTTAHHEPTVTMQRSVSPAPELPPSAIYVPPIPTEHGKRKRLMWASSSSSALADKQ